AIAGTTLVRKGNGQRGTSIGGRNGKGGSRLFIYGNGLFPADHGTVRVGHRQRDLVYPGDVEYPGRIGITYIGSYAEAPVKGTVTGVGQVLELNGQRLAATPFIGVKIHLVRLGKSRGGTV